MTEAMKNILKDRTKELKELLEECMDEGLLKEETMMHIDTALELLEN